MSRLGPRQRRLLDLVEAAVVSIRYPVDCAACFQGQVLFSLQRAGLPATRELFALDGRRVDICVVHADGTVALELEREEPSRSTLAKLRTFPEEVLRVVVFRFRFRHRPIPGCDRVVCVRSSLRHVAWLTEGSAILEEAGPDRGELSRIDGLRKLDAPGTLEALLEGPRLGPRSAARPAAAGAKKAR